MIRREPPTRGETVREALRRALREGPATARDLSAAAGLRERDVAEHLEHLARSLPHDGERLAIEPAACIACGFRFEGRTRLTRPGACPRCRSTRIDPPSSGSRPAAGAADPCRGYDGRSPSPPTRVPTWLLFLVPSLVWGTTWLVIKLQLGVVAPEVSVVWRFGLAAAALLAFCAVRGVRLRASARDHASFVLLGVLQFGLDYVLVYLSEQRLTSGLVSVLFVTVVFWNLLGARVLFGTPAPGRVVAGAVLGAAGVSLVFLPELRHVRALPGLASGAALAILATLATSAGNLWSQRLYARGISVLPSTAWAMLYATLSVALYCAVRGVPFAFEPSLRYVASLAYLAAFGSVLAFVAYLTLLRRIGAGRSGYTAAVTPILAMVSSTVFEGYRWSPPALAGMALVVGGTVLVLRGRARAGGALPAAAAPTRGA